MRAGPDSFETFIPDIVNIGRAYEARRCRIIMILLDRGSISEGHLADLLDISMQSLRETISRMVDEDVLICMTCSGTRTLFLCDRHGWMERALESRQMGTA